MRGPWSADLVWTTRMRALVPDLASSIGFRLGHLAVVETPSTPMEYRGEIVPHRHISVAVVTHTRRPTDTEMAWVREDFNMADADEEQVVEPDGFVWSRKRAQ